MTPPRIAAACADLLAQPEAERVALRAHCRAVALARYTWEGNADGLLEVYRRLAARPMTEPVEAPA